MKKWLARVLPWLITILLIRFLLTQGSDWHTLRQEVAQARWSLLLLAILCQFGAYGAVAWLNELLRSGEGGEPSLCHLHKRPARA